MAKKRANLGPSLLTNRVYTRALHVSIFVSLTSLSVIYIFIFYNCKTCRSGIESLRHLSWN